MFLSQLWLCLCSGFARAWLLEKVFFCYLYIICVMYCITQSYFVFIRGKHLKLFFKMVLDLGKDDNVFK
jgi:hypothetical protein